MWSTKVKSAYQLDGDMFIVVQILPCSVWGGGGGESDREREKEGETERVTLHSDVHYFLYTQVDLMHPQITTLESSTCRALLSGDYKKKVLSMK